MNRSEAIKWLSKCSPMDGSDFADACDFAVDELERTRWIPVSERLPEVRTSALVYHKITGLIDEAWYFDGFRHPYLPQESAEAYDDVTHWMPLPKPPKEVE